MLESLWVVLKRKYRWSIVASCTGAGGGDQAQPTLPNMVLRPLILERFRKVKGLSAWLVAWDCQDECFHRPLGPWSPVLKHPVRRLGRKLPRKSG